MFRFEETSILSTQWLPPHASLAGHLIRLPLKPEAQFSLKSKGRKKTENKKIHSFESVDRRQSVGSVVSVVACCKVRLVVFWCDVLLLRKSSIGNQRKLFGHVLYCFN